MNAVPGSTESSIESTEPGPSTTGPSTAAAPTPVSPPATAPAAVRIATFDASFSGASSGELAAGLATGDDAQAAAVAEIVQRNRPDIVLIAGFDVSDASAVDLFRTNYLAVSQHGADPIEYRYTYTAAVNSGVDSGVDLDHDGTIGGPGDVFGFGDFAGQHGMVLYSRFPIVTDQVRTFQHLRWSAMPDARLPDDPTTPEPGDYYTAAELAVVRLSSASHWDVPVDLGGGRGRARAGVATGAAGR